jgi:hypothetical protein
MAYRPTPALTRTSHTPSPPPEPFDPNLSPIQVLQRVWDSFYVGTALAEGEDDERMTSGRDAGGWDYQTCSIYLSELRVDAKEYWKNTCDSLGAQLTLEEDMTRALPSSSSPLTFTFESFSTLEPASSSSSLFSHSTPTVTTKQSHVGLRQSPTVDPKRKFKPHVSYIACTPTSENLLGSSIDSLQGGTAVPRIDFIPFTDNERFLILAQDPTSTSKGQVELEMFDEEDQQDGQTQKNGDEMDVDMDPSANEEQATRRRPRVALFLSDSSDSDADERVKGYLDHTFGTRKSGYKDAVEWTWMSSHSSVDPDCEYALILLHFFIHSEGADVNMRLLRRIYSTRDSSKITPPIPPLVGRHQPCVAWIRKGRR